MIRWCSLLSLLIVSLSCTENGAGRPAVPTDISSINKAQQEALSATNPLSIQPGEFVYFIKSQEVYTGQQEVSQRLLEEESLTVSERVDYEDYFKVTVLKEVIDHSTEGSPNSKFKDEFYFAKDPQPTSAPPSSNPDVRFYNLQVRQDKVPKPNKVLEQNPCSPGLDCDLSVQKISYDIVYSPPGQPTETTSVETWISTEVPYFASILKSCFTTVLSIESARPLIRQCRSVYDYKFPNLTEEPNSDTSAP